MRPGRINGALLMAGAALQTLLFLFGLRRRSYIALALPVTAALLTLSAVTFWLGWTMLTMAEEPEGPAAGAETSS